MEDGGVGKDGIEFKDGDQFVVEGFDEDNNRSSVGNVIFNVEVDDGEKGEDVDGVEDGDVEEFSLVDEGKDVEYEDGDDFLLFDDDSSFNVEVDIYFQFILMYMFFIKLMYFLWVVLGVG